MGCLIVTVPGINVYESGGSHNIRDGQRLHCKKTKRKITVKSLAAKLPTTYRQITVKNIKLFYGKILFFENGYLP